MVSVPVRCPHCQSTEVIKAGKQANGTQRYQCQNERYGVLRFGLKELLKEGQQAGEFRTDFDPAVEADILFALVDGLAIHVLTEPDRFPSERLVALVDHQLGRLLNSMASARYQTPQDPYPTGSPRRAGRAPR